MDGLTHEELSANVLALTGERPRKIRTIGGGVYHVEFSNLHAAKKMMALHMRELEGCPRPLLVSILEQPLPILELFEVLNDKLAGKERADMYNTTGERQAREVKVKKPQRKVVEGGPAPVASYQVPPPSKVPYLAGFDHPSSSQSASNGGRGVMKEETLPTLFIHLKVGVIDCHLMKMEIPQFRHRRRPMAMVGRGGSRNKIHAPCPPTFQFPRTS